MSYRLFIPLVTLLTLILAACAPSATTPTATKSQPATSATPGPSVSVTSPTARPTTSPAAGSSPSTSADIRYSLVPNGNEARYRVREQLLEQNLPSDAVGATKAVSGAIVLEPNGAIISQQSKFVADIQTLRSDSDRRDNYIKRNTLQTDRYPTAEFVPTEVRGLPSPPPTAGEVKFQLLGNMTAHGVTKPITWEVVAQILDQDLKGSAKTSFKFEDFDMSPPRVPVLLSVENNIVLEIDFHLRRESATP